MKAPASSIPARGPFEGVANIVRFNWPMYVRAVGAIAVLVTITCVVDLPARWRLIGAAVAGSAAWFLVSSLLVSYWIYDRSPLYRWTWLARVPVPLTGNLVNIHAGFDETTPALRTLFPTATWRVLDFYNPRLHSEPSIVRARRRRPPLPDTEMVDAAALPLDDATTAGLFTVLAAHEIRTHTGRVALAREIRRALQPDGVWIVVEHLRDAANFAAFGPGFLHFHSRASWLRVFREARLRTVDEFRVTPFLAVFVLRRDD